MHIIYSHSYLVICTVDSRLSATVYFQKNMVINAFGRLTGYIHKYVLVLNLVLGNSGRYNGGRLWKFHCMYIVAMYIGAIFPINVSTMGHFNGLGEMRWLVDYEGFIVSIVCTSECGLTT